MATQRNVRTLEEELLSFDDNIDTTTEQRAQLTEKALDMARRVSLSDEELKDPKAVAAASAVLTTAMRSLNDTEASSTRRVNAKIKMAESARQDEMSGQVIDLFRKMSSGEPLDLPQVDLDAESLSLTETFLQGGGQILDTELKVDPNDVPK